MDIKKIQEFEETPEEIIAFEWPQAFYLPTDGALRKIALDRAVLEKLEPEKDKIRAEIWERRYNDPAGVDRFLAGYMNLNYYANVVKGSLWARTHKKEMKQTQAYLCYDIPEKYGELGEEMLYLELYHMLDYYIDICLKDKKYGGILMGFGTMKKENLVNKIASDLYKTSHCLPESLEVSPTHELFQKAAKQCFYNRFPNYKEYFRAKQ